MPEERILVNSSEFDPLFADLVRTLDRCAAAGCSNCPLQDDCRQLFDTLSDQVTDKKLSEERYAKFLRQFKGLRKQLIFC
jgi:hypothetical protein